MTATQLSLKLRNRICNWIFHQRRTDVFNENMMNTFIACDTWLKTPFCTLNAGGESPLGTQKTPPPFSLLSKSGVSLYGQVYSRELMSILSSPCLNLSMFVSPIWLETSASTIITTPYSSLLTKFSVFF
jgi:hypothetical protein